MDYGRVFKRSWHMVTRYRALWIFGIVLGLFTFSWSVVLLGGLDDDSRYRRPLVITTMDGETFHDALQRTWQQEIDQARKDFSSAIRELDGLLTDELGPSALGPRFLRLRELGIRVLGERVVTDITTVLIVLAAALGVRVIVGRIARYVSEAALIRMVGQYEDTGQRRGVWKGLRLGMSRTAWRFFLIDLVIDIPVIVAFLLLFALALIPLVFGIGGSAPGPVVAGSLLTGGLFMAGIALAVVAGTLLSVLKRFFRQACGLENQGVIASIRRGWAVVRHNPGQVLLMWLIMLGAELGWTVIIALSILLLFPLLILFIALGGVAGGGLAWLAFLLSSLFSQGALPVLIAVLVGLPIFFLVMFAPWTFLDGLMEVFKSSAWTLLYRQLRAAEDAQHDRVRAVDAASLGAAPAA